MRGHKKGSVSRKTETLRPYLYDRVVFTAGAAHSNRTASCTEIYPFESVVLLDRAVEFIRLRLGYGHTARRRTFSLPSHWHPSLDRQLNHDDSITTGFHLNRRLGPDNPPPTSDPPYSNAFVDCESRFNYEMTTAILPIARLRMVVAERALLAIGHNNETIAFNP